MNLGILARVVLFAGATMLMIPNLALSMIGLVLIIAMLVIEKLTNRQQVASNAKIDSAL